MSWEYAQAFSHVLVLGLTLAMLNFKNIKFNIIFKLFQINNLKLKINF